MKMRMLDTSNQSNGNVERVLRIEQTWFGYSITTMNCEVEDYD